MIILKVLISQKMPKYSSKLIITLIQTGLNNPLKSNRMYKLKMLLNEFTSKKKNNKLGKI